jgi:hypothetical protein
MNYQSNNCCTKLDKLLEPEPETEVQSFAQALKNSKTIFQGLFVI